MAGFVAAQSADSTGIAVVLRLQTETRSREIGLEIVPGPSHVQRVFETAGLSTALPFTHDD